MQYLVLLKYYEVTLICMRTHKVHASKWPASGHLPSGHLPLAFKKAHHKHALHLMKSQLPNHLYISQWTLFNKGTHASVLCYEHHSYLLTVLLLQHLFQTQYLRFYSTYQRSFLSPDSSFFSLYFTPIEISCCV